MVFSVAPSRSRTPCYPPLYVRYLEAIERSLGLTSVGSYIAGRSDMLGNEQRPHAVPKSPSLEEIVAERIAGEAARIAEDLIREAFAVTEFDPDEVYGFMNSVEAAEFLGLPYSSFREIAPSLPRHAITPARFGYLRRELLEWGRDR